METQIEGSLCYAFTLSTDLHTESEDQLVTWTYILGSTGAGKHTVDPLLTVEPLSPDYAKQKETLYPR